MAMQTFGGPLSYAVAPLINANYSVWTKYDSSANNWVVLKPPAGWPTDIYVKFTNSSGNGRITVTIHESWDAVAHTGPAAVATWTDVYAGTMPDTVVLVETADLLAIYLETTAVTSQTGLFVIGKYAPVSSDTQPAYWAGAHGMPNNNSGSGRSYRSPDGASKWDVARLFTVADATGSQAMNSISGATVLVPVPLESSGYRGNLTGVLQITQAPALSLRGTLTIGTVNYVSLPALGQFGAGFPAGTFGVAY